MQRNKQITEYISKFPDDVQYKLNKIREIIAQNAPAAEETINYRMPTFKLNGKNLVHFAGYEKHIGFYPTPDGISEFEPEIKKAGYKYAKGSVQFPLDQELPLDLLARIVKFRVSQQT